MTINDLPIRRLLPHRGNMLLIESASRTPEGTVLCSSNLPPEHMLIDDDGQLESVALIELIAQASASLLAGDRDDPTDPPILGYLAETKSLAVCGSARCGNYVTITARMKSSLGSVHMVEGEVLTNEVEIASASLKLFIDKSGESLDNASPAIATLGRTLPERPKAYYPDSASPFHRSIAESIAGLQTSDDEHKARAEFIFNPTFIGFDGHFPDKPILPGIVTIKAALVTCEQILRRPVQLAGIDRAKFVGMVFPSQNVNLEVALSAMPDGWSVSAKLRDENDLLATIRMSISAS